MAARVLITGGTGLLGLNWAESAQTTHDITLGIHHRVVEFPGIVTQKLSLDSTDNFLEMLDLVQPQYVVHAAGLTSIELCEENPYLAHHANVQLAENVARACAIRNIQLAHISTDHLFSGDQPLLDETAPVAPVNIYGKTKAEAELRVQDVYAEALVIRTNFYGWGPSYRQSFSDWVINNLKNGNPITLFNDIYYSPIYVGRLVNIVNNLFERSATGIFNVVGDERVSKYQFAIRLAEIFGLKSNLIAPGSVRSQLSLVRRPHDMSISNKKVSKELNIKIGGIEEHICMMKSLHSSFIKEI